MLVTLDTSCVINLLGSGPEERKGPGKRSVLDGRGI